MFCKKIGKKKELHPDSSTVRGLTAKHSEWGGGGISRQSSRYRKTSDRNQGTGFSWRRGGGTKGWVVNGLADEKRRLCHLACICINYSFDLYRLTGVCELPRRPRRGFITISDPAAHLDKYPRPRPPPVSCWSVERTLFISVCLQTALSDWSNVLHINFIRSGWLRTDGLMVVMFLLFSSVTSLLMGLLSSWVETENQIKTFPFQGCVNML